MLTRVVAMSSAPSRVRARAKVRLRVVAMMEPVRSRLRGLTCRIRATVARPPLVASPQVPPAAREDTAWDVVLVPPRPPIHSLSRRVHLAHGGPQREQQTALR